MVQAGGEVLMDPLEYSRRTPPPLMSLLYEEGKEAPCYMMQREGRNAWVVEDNPAEGSRSPKRN